MTTSTINPRDEYMFFTWRGISSAAYNCFIVNDKHSLEFVNAPSFSNNYATTLYQNKSYFLGTSVERKTLTFKVACDRITLKEYRDFLKWLNIYSIGILTLDYDDWYGYNVKLSAITESNKYPLYKCDGEMVYSIITTLTFETTDDFYAVHKYITTGFITWDADEGIWVCSDSQFNNETPSEAEIAITSISEGSEYVYLQLTNLGSLDTTFALSIHNINGTLLLEKIEAENFENIISKDFSSAYSRTYLGFFEVNDFAPQYLTSIEYDSGSGQTTSYGVLSPRLEAQGKLVFKNIDTRANTTIPANSSVILKISYTPVPENEAKPNFIVQFQKRTQVI